MEGFMITVIYAHPWEQSYNHAILEKVIDSLKNKNKEFNIIDLNKDTFNPAFSSSELSMFSKGEALDPLVKKYQDILKKLILLFLSFQYSGTIPHL